MLPRMRFLARGSLLVLCCAIFTIHHVEAWRNLVANFGEECTVKPCNGARNLTCNGNTCECKHDEETHEPWYYHEVLEGCLPTVRDHPHHFHDPKDDATDSEHADGDHKKESEPLPMGETIIGKPCMEHDFCTRALGMHSRCYGGKCECHDATTNGKWPVTYYEGSCYRQKKAGEICELPNECRSWNVNLECIMDYTHNPPHSKCTCPKNKDCTSSSGCSKIFVSFTLISTAFLANRVAF